ncbi:MAG: hypothetical protein JXA30_19790 [Deltaproteobacteria bacterium]|nr:hypothetical protein [Deltaproteobacteria bacterium]
MYILGFKFLYFPLLYLLLYRLLPWSQAIRLLPAGTLFFVGWGALLSLVKFPGHPITTILGILVNVSFIPLALLGAALYRDRVEIAALLKRWSLLSLAIGILAIVQSRLAPTHWLNISVDTVTPAFVDSGFNRVTSTFQFCNVFSSYVSLAIVIYLGWFISSIKNKSRFIAVVSLVIFYYGGLQTGSRMAGISALICLLFSIILAGQTGKYVTYAATAIVIGFVALNLADIRIEETVSDRPFVAGAAIERTMSGYLARDTLSDALEASDIWGTGWGPYTMGVWKYAPQLGGAVARTEIMLEGGYLFVLAQTGILGFFFFIWMNLSLLVSSVSRYFSFAWLGGGLAAHSIIANLPVCMQEISVLAIPWWFLVGIYYGQRNRELGLATKKANPLPNRPIRS